MLTIFPSRYLGRSTRLVGSICPAFKELLDIGVRVLLVMSDGKDLEDDQQDVCGVQELDETSLQRLYGPWSPMPPDQVLVLLAKAPFPWWIAGGWAIEAAGGRARRHSDTDVAVLRRDLAAVRDWLSDWHLWEAHAGTLRPLLPGDRLKADREQLWVRRDAYSPWVLDLLLTPDEGGQWLYKRDHSVLLPLEEVGHSVAGVPYLRPSLVLLFKARANRSKDDADRRSLPHLSLEERRWLAQAVRREKPDHPWLSELD